MEYVTVECAGTRFFAVLPERELHFLPAFVECRDRVGASFFLFHGRFRLEHYLIARAGDVDGDAFAAQLPGAHEGFTDVFFRGAFREVDGLAQTVIHEALQGSLDVDVFIRGDVGRDDEDLANMLRKLFDMLATAIFDDLIDDQFRFFGQVSALRLPGKGADIVEGAGAALIAIGGYKRGQDGLAAVAFAACHRSDCAGRGNGGLGGVADAVALMPSTIRCQSNSGRCQSRL